jgi:hypothetical protein
MADVASVAKRGRHKYAQTINVSDWLRGVTTDAIFGHNGNIWPSSPCNKSATAGVSNRFGSQAREDLRGSPESPDANMATVLPSQSHHDLLLPDRLHFSNHLLSYQ